METSRLSYAQAGWCLTLARKEEVDPGLRSEALRVARVLFVAQAVTSAVCVPFRALQFCVYSLAGSKESAFFYDEIFEHSRMVSDSLSRSVSLEAKKKEKTETLTKEEEFAKNAASMIGPLILAKALHSLPPARGKMLTVRAAIVAQMVKSLALIALCALAIPISVFQAAQNICKRNFKVAAGKLSVTVIGCPLGIMVNGVVLATTPFFFAFPSMLQCLNRAPSEEVPAFSGS